ncbi:hypothetical protein [Okeania sp. KiyG1]|nr:hypothetical protein [Okeania sp. KiyG1]
MWWKKYLLHLSIVDIAIANSFCEAPELRCVVEKIPTSSLYCGYRNS